MFCGWRKIALNNSRSQDYWAQGATQIEPLPRPSGHCPMLTQTKNLRVLHYHLARRRGYDHHNKLCDPPRTTIRFNSCHPNIHRPNHNTTCSRRLQNIPAHLTRAMVLSHRRLIGRLVHSRHYLLHRRAHPSEKSPTFLYPSHPCLLSSRLDACPV
jgi:hypothetical protein